MSREAQQFYGKLARLWDSLETADDATAHLASQFLKALSGEGSAADLPSPFAEAVEGLHKEYDLAASGERAEAFTALNALLDDSSISEERLWKATWRALFPEALHLHDDPELQIGLLRDKRRIEIIHPVKNPISDPVSEIIFTSNVLLSPPAGRVNEDEYEESGNETNGGRTAQDLYSIMKGAAEAADEAQLYWYDHPIPVGVPPENDEALYGLKGLAEALEYEKRRGTASPASKLRVALSVSVTHKGLHKWARPWLRSQLERSAGDSLKDLEIWAFTEDDAARIATLLSPWLPEGFTESDLIECFGVDGEYGRHYSFLKALPALWSVAAAPGTKGTFKIDLDQVFPQPELAAETGKSALEHFTTPLWGAVAKDAEGRELELGMIAGALVNEKDINAGLFTPDIPWPAGLPEGEDGIFYKLQPMAVSTRAELMTVYGTEGAPDGNSEALQRIHVTGGTNGIRFDALRRHRPFTPSFVGRAEDQAYILSVLSGTKGSGRLAYLHASGLIMRHDKEAFATDAVKAGKAGSYVGDLVRLFVFSAYAKMLPIDVGELKKIVDPFTGCFITPIPATLAFLRLALHLRSSEGGDERERNEMLELASRRLKPWVSGRTSTEENLEKIYRSEQRVWNAYYDALDALEHDLEQGNQDAKRAAASFVGILDDCRIDS